MLVLLASFMHYPSSPETTQTANLFEKTMVFPISEQIKLARSEKKISQKDLADRVGLSLLNLERIEKGKVMPTRDVLRKLENELSTKLSMK
jgi:ribosome-binding protein aMBF1 (putative translation factor)